MNIENVKQIQVALRGDQPKPYSFALSVADFLKVGCIERLNETTDGVQRKQTDRRVASITEAIAKQNASLSENFTCEIRGEYHFDEKFGILDLKDGCYLSVLNGGGRFGALRALPPAVQQTMSVQVAAFPPLTLAQRKWIFSNQTHQTRVDQRHMLALADATDEWPDAEVKEVYKLLQRLNGDDNSPLGGKISFTEGERKHQGRHVVDGANVTGLIPTFRRVLYNRTTPLGRKGPGEREQYVIDLFRAARATWPNQWDDPKCIATSSRGIRALLLLLTKSPNYRGCLGDVFTTNKVFEAVAMASTYNWSFASNKGKSPDQIVEGLDRSIGSKVSRRP